MLENEVLTLIGTVHKVKSTAKNASLDFSKLDEDVRASVFKKAGITGAYFEPLWRACFSKDTEEIESNFQMCTEDPETMSKIKKALDVKDV
jgi:hypothetical protein